MDEEIRTPNFSINLQERIASDWCNYENIPKCLIYQMDPSWCKEFIETGNTERLFFLENILKDNRISPDLFCVYVYYAVEGENDEHGIRYKQVIFDEDFNQGLLPPADHFFEEVYRENECKVITGDDSDGDVISDPGVFVTIFPKRLYVEYFIKCFAHVGSENVQFYDKLATVSYERFKKITGMMDDSGEACKYFLENLFEFCKSFSKIPNQFSDIRQKIKDHLLDYLVDIEFEESFEVIVKSGFIHSFKKLLIFCWEINADITKCSVSDLFAGKESLTELVVELELLMELDIDKDDVNQNIDRDWLIEEIKRKFLEFDNLSRNEMGLIKSVGNMEWNGNVFLSSKELVIFVKNLNKSKQNYPLLSHTIPELAKEPHVFKLKNSTVLYTKSLFCGCF